MESKQKNKKEIFSYLKRIFWFCITIKFAFTYIGGIVMILFYWFLEPIIQKIAQINTIKELNNETLIYSDYYHSVLLSKSIDYSTLVYAFITMYFLAKIFSIFKKLDNLNFFISLTIIVGISFILIIIGKINFLTPNYIYEIGLNYSYTMYLLVPCFLFYKFLYIFTKTFPIPFQKLNYYFSLEFYKKLIMKFKK